MIDQMDCRVIVGCIVHHSHKDDALRVCQFAISLPVFVIHSVREDFCPAARTENRLAVSRRNERHVRRLLQDATLNPPNIGVAIPQEGALQNAGIAQLVANAHRRCITKIDDDRNITASFDDGKHRFTVKDDQIVRLRCQ